MLFFRFLRHPIQLLYGIIRAGSVPLKAITLGRTRITQYVAVVAINTHHIRRLS
jgi:hypothetical protein